MIVPQCGNIIFKYRYIYPLKISSSGNASIKNTVINKIKILNNNIFTFVFNVISTHPNIEQITRPIDAGIIQRKNPRRNEKVRVRIEVCPNSFQEILSVLRANSKRATVNIVAIIAIIK